MVGFFLFSIEILEVREFPAGCANGNIDFGESVTTWSTCEPRSFQFQNFLPASGDFFTNALSGKSAFILGANNSLENGRGGEIRTHDLLYPKQAR